MCLCRHEPLWECRIGVRLLAPRKLAVAAKLQSLRELDVGVGLPAPGQLVVAAEFRSCGIASFCARAKSLRQCFLDVGA